MRIRTNKKVTVNALKRARKKQRKKKREDIKKEDMTSTQI
jgi:hypothetical protein